MKEILYIGPNNPREVVRVKKKNIKNLLKTGLYKEIDNHIYEKELFKLKREEQEEILDKKSVDYSYKDKEKDLVKKIIRS